MVVLGVDPGTVATGYGVVAAAGSRFTCLAQGDVRAPAKWAMAERLNAIHAAIADLIARHRPDALALEEAFIARNPQTALKLGQARGVILLAGAQAGVPVFGYAPAHVKLAVVGHGRAEKDQISFMITRILGLGAPPASEHAADALGLAYCHLQQGRLRSLAAGAGAAAPRSGVPARSGSSGRRGGPE
jgi:crossover junction endodeoxyribonuclease RuvC